MLDRTKDIAVSAQAWLDEFERTLGRPDRDALHLLFLADGFWRDVLALSWNLQTIAGRDAITDALTALADQTRQNVITQVFVSYYALQTAEQRVATADDLLASAEQSAQVAAGR